MKPETLARRLPLAIISIIVLAGGVFILERPASTLTAAPVATAPLVVSVAQVEQQDVRIWSEFSGRLEAVERVAVRSRVVGEVNALHFTEGELVNKGDLLVTIDPLPFAAEVQRAQAQVAAAQSRLDYANTELARAQKLWPARAIAERELDERANARTTAAADLTSAQALLQMARLNLGHTSIRAPVAGRVGRREVTVGNLVDAGPTAPVLTTLVSVNPIYASFDADEPTVTRALNGLGAPNNRKSQLPRIPVEMMHADGQSTLAVQGHLQLIDNQVDTASGTMRVRAQFDNPDGRLTPGQFVRLRLGQAETRDALLVSERAIGTDQNRRYVMVVGDDNLAEYREVTVGAMVNGLRVITQGLNPGERIVVNGLQRVRPGTAVAPQEVSMLGSDAPVSSVNPDNKRT
jgi:multidrug efflux system membrane fusion protein